jgi:ParB-like nuclease family protein
VRSFKAGVGDIPHGVKTNATCVGLGISIRSLRLDRVQDANSSLQGSVSLLDLSRGLRPLDDLKVVVRSLSELKPNPRNARIHSRRQIRQIADSIQAFAFNNPVLIDEDGRIIAGHGRVEAAKLLGMTEVPTVCLAHLSEAEKRA